MAALQAIDELILDKTSRKWKDTLALEFSHLVYDGRWFTPLKESILAAADAFSQLATGEVVLKLYKGQVTAVQKQSENSLYSEQFATFGADDVYDQSHAEGFIRLFSLSSRIAAINKQ
jgi:argininosuccinate synthase